MPDRPTRLREAPIVEAILSVQFEPWDGGEWHAHAERLADDWRPEFPEQHPIQEVSFSFPVGPEGPAPTRQALVQGLRLIGADGRRVVMLRNGALGVHLLAPYRDWPELVGLLDTAWERLVADGGVFRLVRLSARFLNHIRIPNGVDMGQTLVHAPPIVEDNPAHQYGITEWTDRIVAVTPDDVRLVVQRRLPVGGTPEFLDLLLDIEASCVISNRSQPEPFSTMFAGELDRLRDEKNTQFHGALTPQALDRYGYADHPSH